MSAGASRRADEDAPARTWTGLDVLAQVLETRYPDIKPMPSGQFLELYPKAPGLIRHLRWDGDAGTYAWYSGPDHGAHLKRDAFEAAAQIAVIMGSAYA
jgi:hypothetical protein